MPNKDKINVVQQTTDRIRNANGIYFTKYTGLDVKKITDLRKSFRENNVEFVVTKNTLTKIAAKEAGFEGLFDKILQGQIGIAYAEDVTAPARIIKDFKKENDDLLNVVGLFFEGEMYPTEKYLEFANLPTKEESLSKLAIMINQPMTRVALVLNGCMSKLVNTLTSLKDTKN